MVQFRPEQNITSHVNPSYALTKNAGTLLSQVIAEHADPEKLQIVSLHPGVVCTPAFAKVGVTPDMLPFDDRKCCGTLFDHHSDWCDVYFADTLDLSLAIRICRRVSCLSGSQILAVRIRLNLSRSFETPHHRTPFPGILLKYRNIN